MNELIGRTLGQYRIVEKIGAGGMATIYKAYQPSLDRYVGIKVLPPFHAEQPGFSERFQREARAIANLNHPNILPVFDFGQEGDYSFIVMRYVEGARTLQEVMKGSLGLRQVMELVGQIASALDHAHERGVVHRDVKPSNVLMDGDWALLTDFGLAKMTEASVKLTGSGVGIGTPAYMSPEQGQGLEVDQRTDVYSLGVILFEVLTGQIPHNAETPFGIVLKRMTEPLPLPRSINPEIPEAVERVILKALAADPADRFQMAGEMARALVRAAEATPAAPGVEAEPLVVRAETIVTAPSLPLVVPEKESVPVWKRMPMWAWGAVGGVALLLVVVLLFAAGSDRKEPGAVIAQATDTAPPTVTATSWPTEAPLAVAEVLLTATAPAAAMERPLSAAPAPTATKPPPTQTPAPTATKLPPTQAPAPTATKPPPTATPAPTAAEVPPPAPPIPTATPPPPTAKPVVVYQSILLSGVANGSSDFLSPPQGAVTLAGVPFQLSDRVFKSQAALSPFDGFPTSIPLGLNVPQAYRVHLLLNTGNGFNEFNGRAVGQVVAYCDGAAIFLSDLQLGRDVREWHVADNVVSTASRARQVWSGAIADFPDLTGHIDMLSLDLPDACRSGSLTALEVIDSSASTVNSLDPALILTGVTVEYNQ